MGDATRTTVIVMDLWAVSIPLVLLVYLRTFRRPGMPRGVHPLWRGLMEAMPPQTREL